MRDVGMSGLVAEAAIGRYIPTATKPRNGTHDPQQTSGRCEAQPMRSASETMIPSGPRT